METIPLEMDDIFDENDDDIVPTRLPDLDDMDLDGNLEPMRDLRYEDENNDQADTGEENPELLAKLKSLKGASKNVKKRTLIKLDAARLTGERGIPILPKVFENVRLKGKHHEIEDLKTIMHHFEHWGHRLFPKMPFAEVLDRAERLGAKKEVQTCVKRIRLGMPILPSDVAEEEDDVQRGGGEEDVTPTTEESSSVSNTSVSNQIPNDDEIDEFLSVAAELEQEASQSQMASQRDTVSSQGLSSNDTTMKSSLSEETKAKIERNKRLAMERRAARLAKVNEPTNSTVTSSPSLSTGKSGPLTENMTPVNDQSEQQNDLKSQDSNTDNSLEDEQNIKEKEDIASQDNDQNSKHNLSDNQEQENIDKLNDLGANSE